MTSPAPFDANRWAATVAAVYAEAELAITRMIARRLSIGLDATNWQTQRLADINAVRAAAQVIADHTAINGRASLIAALAASFRSGTQDVIAAVADMADPSLAAAARRVSANALRARGPVLALVDDMLAMLRPLHERIVPQAVDAYRRAIAGAAARYLAGGSTRRQAAQAAWAELVDAGITVYVDTSGRRWRLSTYVEMATRTAANRAVAQGAIDAATAAGQRLLYVDSHRGRCELCAPWEHKVLSLWGPTGRQVIPHATKAAGVFIDVAATVDAARAAGLLHPNCSHRLRPFYPGRTTMTVVADDQGAGYADRQRQRQLERAIRRWREQQQVALTDEARRDAAAKVHAFEQALLAHLRTTGLPRQKYREWPGAGHEPPPGRRTDRTALATT